MPLHLACRRGNLEATRILLAELREVDSVEKFKDAHGDTPLHQACLYGHEEIVEVLLEMPSKIFSTGYNMI